MNRDDIDRLWHQALHQSVVDGETFTRYHFAALVAAAEREACANVVNQANIFASDSPAEAIRKYTAAIRARGME